MLVGPGNGIAIISRYEMWRVRKLRFRGSRDEPCRYKLRFTSSRRCSVLFFAYLRCLFRVIVPPRSRQLACCLPGPLTLEHVVSAQFDQPSTCGLWCYGGPARCRCPTFGATKSPPGGRRAASCRALLAFFRPWTAGTSADAIVVFFFIIS
jgi:hypothetical protein